MKLHLTQAEGQNLITSYGEGWVEINRKRYAHSLIVMPETIIEDWSVADFESMKIEDLQRLADLKPEVVLLGTGAKHRFIHPRLSAPLTALGVSVECMDTAAACRTYNILMGEGRNVATALIV
jgi:uncharacterized protein